MTFHLKRTGNEEYSAEAVANSANPRTNDAQNHTSLANDERSFPADWPFSDDASEIKATIRRFAGFAADEEITDAEIEQFRSRRFDLMMRRYGPDSDYLCSMMLKRDRAGWDYCNFCVECALSRHEMRCAANRIFQPTLLHYCSDFIRSSP